MMQFSPLTLQNSKRTFTPTCSHESEGATDMYIQLWEPAAEFAVWKKVQACMTSLTHSLNYHQCMWEYRDGGEDTCQYKIYDGRYMPHAVQATNMWTYSNVKLRPLPVILFVYSASKLADCSSLKWVFKYSYSGNTGVCHHLTQQRGCNIL